VNETEVQEVSRYLVDHPPGTTTDRLEALALPLPHGQASFRPDFILA
jgi:hypothetical protein